MQDAFLISSESNLRNIQVGIHEAKSYGIDSKEHMYIGYFLIHLEIQDKCHKY